MSHGTPPRKQGGGWGLVYKSSVVCMAPWRIMARRACSARLLLLEVLLFCLLCS